MLIESAELEDSAVEGNWPIVDSTVRGLAMPFSLPRVMQDSWKAVWLVRVSWQPGGSKFSFCFCDLLFVGSGSKPSCLSATSALPRYPVRVG